MRSTGSEARVAVQAETRHASQPSRGLHVALIMDGSGRWATRRGLPRTAGHLAGLEAVRRTVDGSIGHGIANLTLFAFSSDNWQRPPGEIATLLEIFMEFLSTHAPVCGERGIRLSVIGRRDRVGGPLRAAMEAAEDATRGGTALHVRLAIDYSGRDAILNAAKRWIQTLDLGRDRGPGQDRAGAVAADNVRGAASGFLDSEDAREPLPDVDLLIRTGGERRLSDFLLWECAYAELLFLDRMWPDFGPSDLTLALADYSHRERRFGGIVGKDAGVALP